MTTSFHKSNFGRFGDSLPCDMAGYVHLTAGGWKNAPVDFGGEQMTDEDLTEWAEEKAEEAREATEQGKLADLSTASISD